MSNYFTDNYDKFEALEREKQRWLISRPVCAYCDHPIQENKFYEIDCEKVCKECLEIFFGRDVDDE